MKTKSIEKALPNSVQVKNGVNKEDLIWVQVEEIKIDDKTLKTHLDEKDKVIKDLRNHLLDFVKKYNELVDRFETNEKALQEANQKIKDLMTFEVIGD